MKLFIAKLIVLSAIMVAFTPFAIAQAATENAPADNSPQTAASDDRLSFMPHEEAKESADSVSTGGIILKTFGAMLIIVGLIFFAAWGLKKFGFGNKSNAHADAPELTIVSTVTVGSGRTISSIKFGSRVLLVGSTPQSFTLLADGPDDNYDGAFPAAASIGPRSVAEMLEAEESFDKEFAKADAGLISLFNGGRS
jgi:flagellar biogenesis protein FliO